MSQVSSDPPTLVISLFSFGFKHGAPEAEMVWDVRFLPNPYWVPELKDHTGLEPVVAHYVLGNESGEKFMQLAEPLLDFIVTRFSATTRAEIRLAIGCTGGRHRSVAVAEYLHKFLRDRGFRVTISHRDIGKE